MKKKKYIYIKIYYKIYLILKFDWLNRIISNYHLMYHLMS